MDDSKEHKGHKEQHKKAAAKTGIKNISGRRHKIYGAIIQPGETYTPNEADKADDLSVQRIKNAIASGHLERV